MTRIESTFVWVSTLLVAGSGVGVGVSKYLIVSDDPFAAVNHPLQPFFLKMHVLAAPILVFAFGMVVANHAWRRWTSGAGEGRRSGALLVVTSVPMIVTGYLIQTVASRSAVLTIVVVHVVTGAAYLAVIGAHQMRAWSASRSARRRSVDVLTRRAS